MPRIALVTQGFMTIGGGGVPALVRFLHDQLSPLGYEVDIHDLASSRSDGNSRRLAAPASWIRRSLRAPSSSNAVLTSWGANLVEFEPMRYRPRAELTRTLQSYDLIHVVAGASALGAAVLDVTRPVALQAATAVKWERTSRRAEGQPVLQRWRDWMTVWTARIEQRALRGADAVLVLNADLQAFAGRSTAEPPILAPSGIDVDEFSPGLQGWRRDGYLLFVGRLVEPRKGLDRLIRAYHELVEIYPEVPRLVLAGQGDLPAKLRRQIQDADLAERVSVKSDVPSDKLPGLYRGASVFVQTSHEEGLGISVLEAMACGLPVVATDTSGTRETVVDGSTGRLVPQDDEDALPKFFAGYLRQTLAETGPAMSIAGRERCVQLFSTTAVIARYLQLYDRLLAEAASAD